MADEPKQENKPVEEKIAPPKEETQVQEDWKEIVGGKYKSEAELAKAYKDLEKKFGSQSEEVRQAKEFAQIVNPLLEEIRNDPQIFQQLDEKLRKRNEPDKPDKKSDNILPDDVRETLVDQIVSGFEDKYGVSKLSAEEQKELREKMGAKIAKLTGKKLNQIDLRKLKGVLEEAFVLANEDKIVDKDKLKALLKEDGAISSVPANAGKKEESLTSEEASIAEKLGLTREQYLKGKRK